MQTCTNMFQFFVTYICIFVSVVPKALLRVSSSVQWLKLLWAPLTECLYFVRLGKRKTWLIPCQYLLGLIMLYTSYHLDTWVGNKDNQLKPNVLPICILMLIAGFLLTTLDMVVDSWAISMLQRENVGHQATCNLIGFKIGDFFGNILFIVLQSKDISAYLGQETSILSFSGYFFFWSVVLLIANTAVLLFKKDTSLDVINKNMEQRGVVESYKLIWDVLRLKPVRQLSIILLLSTTAVGPIFSLTRLKLIEGGMTADKQTLLAIPFIPVQSLLPVFFRRYFQSKQGLKRYSQTLIYMIGVGFLNCALIFYMQDFKKDGQLGATFYIAYFIIHGIEHMILFLMNASYMSFISRITDPTYGAVYLTVVHTIRIGGFIWPAYVSLFLVEPLTFYKHGCGHTNDCKLLDGYHILILIGSLFTVFYLHFGGRKAMLKVQELHESEWKVPVKGDDNKVEENMEL